MYFMVANVCTFWKGLELSPSGPPKQLHKRIHKYGALQDEGEMCCGEQPKGDTRSAIVQPNAPGAEMSHGHLAEVRS